MADIPCVGAVVFDGTGRLLLVKRANPPAQGLWSLPGGRLEVGESPQAGVIREVHEETAIGVRVLREVGSIEREAPTGDTYVIDDFLCAMVEESLPRAGDDAADARFFEVSELTTLPTSEGLIEALTEWGLLDVPR
jgi:ADP-ribose pyrophosphatase YjhB (NUDIX family)